MTTTAMRKKLTDYLQTADVKKVRAIYTMVEDDIADGPVWDEEFFEEMERRSKSFEDGTAKTYTWEETKQAAIDSLKLKRK
jgi:hypothetical protein